MLSKLRYRRWHQRRLSLWCGPDQAESKSGQHEEMISLCKGSGELYNLKCPWPEAERAEELKRTGSLDVRLPPLATSARGPHVLLEAELAALTSPVLQRGDPGEGWWRCSKKPRIQLLTPGSRARVFCRLLTLLLVCDWSRRHSCLTWFAQQSL